MMMMIPRVRCAVSYRQTDDTAFRMDAAVQFRRLSETPKITANAPLTKLQSEFSRNCDQFPRH